MVCLWCRRTVARSVARPVYGHVITNFLGWVDYHISSAMGLRARVELRYYYYYYSIIIYPCALEDEWEEVKMDEYVFQMKHFALNNTEK